MNTENSSKDLPENSTIRNGQMDPDKLQAEIIKEVMQSYAPALKEKKEEIDRLRQDMSRLQFSARSEWDLYAQTSILHMDRKLAARKRAKYYEDEMKALTEIIDDEMEALSKIREERAEQLTERLKAAGISNADIPQ